MNTLDFSRRKVCWPKAGYSADWVYLPWELWEVFNPNGEDPPNAWFFGFALSEGHSDSIWMRLPFIYT